MFAYQSAAEIDGPISDSINCFSILQHDLAPSSPLWTETHCKKTADAIIALCAHKGVLSDGDSDARDLRTFKETTVGQQLLSESDAPEHKLFFVNIAGGGHVAIIEKIGDNQKTHWNIFQSWQNEFTLAQWMGIDNWKNKKFDNDFSTFGRGRNISLEQLTGFLVQTVTLCKNRLEQFKNLMLATPHELDVKSFHFNDDTLLTQANTINAHFT